MTKNLTQKLIEAHLVVGKLEPGEEIALRIDQTLTQDATGTLVMLELEAMHLDRVQTEVSVQYVDHNLIQEDYKNPDDHLFLQSVCQRMGIIYSRPGNGVSHPLHQERFGIPGKTLLGSDSHTPAAGALAMLAIGAGGIEVALAMAGQPFYIKMPEVWGVRLAGELPDWVSAKDVILEMLRRHGVDGGVGRVIEYHGPGVASLTAMDRHVITNMGTELGATSSVFPTDEETLRYLTEQEREDDFSNWTADDQCSYDHTEEIILSNLEPLIAMPSSPGNVRAVREAQGAPIYQAYIGSSANPGLRDFAIAAEIVAGRRVASSVSFDINPTSRQVLLTLMRNGQLGKLIEAGARLHQAGCNGCIGMGQAPASGKLSLRTVPRNFPGRSGTPDDKVCLVSPETAAASALMGKITDPRTIDCLFPKLFKTKPVITLNQFEFPPGPDDSAQIEIQKGPNIISFPDFESFPPSLELPVLLKLSDDVSTDEIMPAGSRVLPYRSNIPKISEFVFETIDPSYAQEAAKLREKGGHILVAGDNYGQGSSREHAALAPRFLGLRLVVAKSFARIHWQNLINFGVLPLQFVDPRDYDRIAPGDLLSFDLSQVRDNEKVFTCPKMSRSKEFELSHTLSNRQLDIVQCGGLSNWVRQQAA